MLHVVTIPAGSYTDDDDNNGHHGHRDIDFRNFVIAMLLMILLLVIFAVVLFSVTGYFKSCPSMKFQVNSVEMNLLENSNDKRMMAADLTVELKVDYKDDQTDKYFKSLIVTLEYEHGNDHEFLSSTSISSIVKDYNPPHTITFQMQFKDGDDNRLSNTVDSITKDLWGEQHVVQFSLKIKGSYVWYHFFVSKCKVKATCHRINVGFSPESNFTTGTMIGAPLLCKHKH